MGKNIVIFSDATGKRGGLLVDEHRSNIYKLYRATRPGPDSYVDAVQQVAFYDPGLGTLPAGIDSIASIIRTIYNFASQATGLGLTGNIIDCYAEIIRLYRPGDRIYLCGFSRGAYTVRCLAGVIRWCGIPTRTPTGEKFGFNEKSAKKVAKEGVKQVYQHATSRPEHPNSKPEDRPTPRQRVWLQQRRELAERFRKKYDSDVNGEPNVVPWFIGVFDTVASLANPVVSLFFLIGLAAVLACTGWLIAYWLDLSWMGSVLSLLSLGALVGGIAFLSTHVKAAFGFNGGFWHLKGYRLTQLIHFTEFRMRFYDRVVNTDVEYVRHAISIDENRKSFPRERIDQPAQWPGRRRAHGPWLTQLWFAGNHSDVGGSYHENESRLSDIALTWMSVEAEKTGLILDRRFLQLYPSADGMQHDECKSSLFKYFGKIDRDPPKDAPLHPSVIRRFEEPDVLHYDTRRSYRPHCLRDNRYVSHFWMADEIEQYFPGRAREEAIWRVNASQVQPYAGRDISYWESVAFEIARRESERTRLRSVVQKAVDMGVRDDELDAASNT